MTKSGLYIQLFSVHGLVRSSNMELGRDADTGGQVKYVIELAKSLSLDKRVAQVDLFTRLISDKVVSPDYADPVEVVHENCRIVRIPCGGGKYIRKELLWPHLDEFVDKTIRFIKREKRVPDLVHGHYADGGYVAMQLAEVFGSLFVFTGHSLGRSKKMKLINDGMKENDIQRRYKIDQRIAVEEKIIRSADLIVTSTSQEMTDQYGLYDNNRHDACQVIPPGLDVNHFYPYYHGMLPDSDTLEEAKYAEASLIQELERFFLAPDKPIVLALCRPDKRKNISGLIEAYGGDLELQAMANLAIFAGIRKNISDMEENERSVLTDMLLLMDKFDLYGKMAIPKQHDFEYEVPALYRLVANKRGVFVNPALTEPFGITLIEASATGLPIVATQDGGPQDIVKACRSGVLVDPTRPEEIAKSIKKIIADNRKWEQYSKNGILNVKKHYTWAAHAKRFVSQIGKLTPERKFSQNLSKIPVKTIGKRLTRLDRLIVTDIDNTLIGCENRGLPEFVKRVIKNRERIGFAVATGRTVDSAVSWLKKHDVPEPDIVIASVGAEIYYGAALQYEKGWETHIAHKWDRERIKRLLDDFDFLVYQQEDTQRRFKISYDMAPSKDRLPRIHERLRTKKCRYNLIYSHDQYLDVLPYRASKGKAIRYLSYKWDIPLKHFLVCGDSGNDLEMLRGEPRGVVVSNYSAELEGLKGVKNIYFSKKPCAEGILEGMKHFRFD